AKYRLLRDRVLQEGIIAPENLMVAEPATVEQLLFAHDSDYIDKVLNGTLSAKEQRRLGFPWSPELARRSVRTVGATIGACRAALDDGVAVNLAGGTHHACRDHGEGYCVFNDSAVAARTMQAERRVRRVVILDCDVHQGNGTAAILAGDSTVFTFSIHGAKNFPFHKERSDLDLELPDGTTDDLYLAMVEEGVRRAIAQSSADLAIYLAGADPYRKDRLGRMAISLSGLAERDNIVLGLCREMGLPVAVTMAGGYAEDVEEIVAIHLQTVRTTAAMVFQSG
ncbi:MAG TPA: histone deacetylase, partial [Oceanobacillus sp.]|nr:histone deacetylase [Oceanobacillus sp.]